MIVLVTGGASSGKSALAEQMALSLTGPHVYLATMNGQGEAARERVARHRALRAGKGFETIERESDLAGLELPAQLRYGTVLVEDVGNLVANALFAPDGLASEAGSGDPGGFFARIATDDEFARAYAQRLAGDILSLVGQCANLVVVTNEVGCDGVRYDDATHAYLVLLGAVSCSLAEKADTVCESACGLPIVTKGVRI